MHHNIPDNFQSIECTSKSCNRESSLRLQCRSAQLCSWLARVRGHRDIGYWPHRQWPGRWACLHKRGPLGFILSGRLRSHVSAFSTTLPMVPSESLPRSTRPHWLRSPGARAPGSGGGRPAPCLASAAVQRRESTARATGSNSGASVAFGAGVPRWPS